MKKTQHTLRQQKTRQLRTTIQDVALQLFARSGYDAVTMDHIALQANVSRSTLFRHFKTKEAIVLYNSMDMPLADLFRRQPASLTTVQALRCTFQELLTQTGESGKRSDARNHVIRSVPAVRAAMMGEVAANITMLTELIAERSGKTPDDIEVFSLASALMGISLGVLFEANDDYLLRLDAALARLETGWCI